MYGSIEPNFSPSGFRVQLGPGPLWLADDGSRWQKLFATGNRAAAARDAWSSKPVLLSTPPGSQSRMVAAAVDAVVVRNSLVDADRFTTLTPGLVAAPQLASITSRGKRLEGSVSNTDAVPALVLPTTTTREQQTCIPSNCLAGPSDQAGYPHVSRWCYRPKAEARFSPPLRDSSSRTLRRLMFVMSPERVCPPRSTGLIDGLCGERFLQPLFLKSASLSPRPRDAGEDH